MKKLLQSAAFALILSPATGQWSDQNSNISNDLESVTFINASEGWAVGRQGKIIHTTNAGNTWTAQNSGTTSDLNKVHMLNATFGVAVGDGGTVVKYNGSSWSAATSGTSQDLYSVFFTDANTGWIGGDYAIIKKTTNGGSSFTAENTSSWGNTFRDIHLFSATDGWAVGSTGSVFKYDGSSWNAFTNPYTGTGTGPNLYSVSFSSPINGFATGQNSSVLHFDGTSWSIYGTNLPDNTFHIYDVQAINNNLAYAVATPSLGGAGCILKYDGSNWNVDYVYSGIDSEIFKGVSFPTATKGYAVGSGGMIKTKGSATTASIGEQAGNISLSVFPNPVTDEATVAYSLTSGSDVTISFHDLSGKLLNSQSMHQPAGDHAYKLDCSFLPGGMYFVKVLTNAGLVTVSLVK